MNSEIAAWLLYERAEERMEELAADEGQSYLSVSSRTQQIGQLLDDRNDRSRLRKMVRREGFLPMQQYMVLISIMAHDPSAYGPTDHAALRGI